MINSYDRRGKKLTLWEGARLLGNPQIRRVAVDAVGETAISTMHTVTSLPCYDLDCPKRGNPESPDAIFETAIDSLPVGRWHTLQEAMSGHQKILKEVKEKQNG